MTEEDQILVAKAVLAGVRFSRATTGFWQETEGPTVGWLTVGRCAAAALNRLGLLTVDEFCEYERRTGSPDVPVDVDCDGW